MPPIVALLGGAAPLQPPGVVVLHARSYHKPITLMHLLESAVDGVTGAHPETLTHVEARIAQPEQLLAEQRGMVNGIGIGVVVDEVVPLRAHELLVAAQIAEGLQTLRSHDGIVLPRIEVGDPRRGRLENIGQQQRPTRLKPRRHIAKERALPLTGKVMDAERRDHAAQRRRQGSAPLLLGQFEGPDLQAITELCQPAAHPLAHHRRAIERDIAAARETFQNGLRQHAPAGAQFYQSESLIPMRGDEIEQRCQLFCAPRHKYLTVVKEALRIALAPMIVGGRYFAHVKTSFSGIIAAPLTFVNPSCQEPGRPILHYDTWNEQVADPGSKGVSVAAGCARRHRHSLTFCERSRRALWYNPEQ